MNRSYCEGLNTGHVSPGGICLLFSVLLNGKQQERDQTLRALRLAVNDGMNDNGYKRIKQ